MLKILFFLKFVTIFFFSINAKIETFTLAANEVDTFIIPVFSTNSTLENFNDTLNFLFNFPNFPKSFWFYAFGDIHPCSSQLPYSCNITNYETQSSNSLDDPNFVSKIYENSVIENEHSCYVYLKLAYLLALKISPLCDNSTNCFIRRINFIALTDYERIENFYNFTDTTVLKQAFYFAFTTAAASNNNSIDNYFCIYDNSLEAAMEEDIFGDQIYYTFDPTKNYYNVFIVTNETSLNKMAALGDCILQDAYSSIQNFWGFLSPMFYVASVKLQNESYYQTVNVFLNGMSSIKFITSLQTVVYGSLTETLNTSLSENYLKQIYNCSNFDKNEEQWNVIITDHFPHWLKKTNIIFNSFFKHLDVYLMSFDDNFIANKLENGMKNHLNEILINDKNATKRGNHVLLLPFDGLNSMYEAVKQMPTIKKYMGATIFAYQEPNRWWIWIIIGSILLLIFITVILTVILWKYRKWKRIMQKYSWAVDSGISIKEANTFVEAGKELFIDGSFISVDFNEIIGKGSSAVVYEGFLSTESPVAKLCPRLETRNYSNSKLAIKIGNSFSKDEFEQIFREVEAASKIGWHRHICCLLGWSVYQSMPILAFELIEGMNLLSWAQSFQDFCCSEDDEENGVRMMKSLKKDSCNENDDVRMVQSLKKDSCNEIENDVRMMQSLDPCNKNDEIRMMQPLQKISCNENDEIRMMQSVQNSTKMIPEKSATQILWQISDGMEYLASLGILHKDLAARNILLSQRLEAKITDFGLATITATSSCSDETSKFTYEAPIQRRLPLRWMAPEALKNRSFSEASEVWSFGILAWEVFSKGEIPYGTFDGNDILEYILAGNRLKIPEKVSEDWKTLLLKNCWSEKKEARASFKEIKSKIGAFLESQTLSYGYLITTFDEK